MESTTYSLSDILTVAGLHPFYNPDVQYPPDEPTIRAALESAAGTSSKAKLAQQPLLLKNTLSLDLMLEILENAQATVLSGGTTMAPADVIGVLIQYNVNVLTGDSGQIVGIAHHISKLPETERNGIKLNKIIYTSEAFTTSQRKYVLSILGPVKICSVLGSAEAGPYAASCDYMTDMETTNYADFIFDTRALVIEIFPSSFADGGQNPTSVPEGQKGIIAQTSLSRLRHPLVRYITGDVGSLHDMPESARAVIHVAERAHLRILRLYGRDHRFSSTWNGEYFEFSVLASIMNNPHFGVLQWQVILDKLEPSMEAALTVRLLLPSMADAERKTPAHQQALFDQLRTFFCVDTTSEHRFQIVLVDDIAGFERSATGNKVIKFIDRLTD
ncbi:hypothetical protein KJ359_007243 [Pestalotiopsis sp. 9143b]|nr:hypothetical protein KJ359_007243 [Pestalotiopsis sp. 9143b]